jgi:hypothetical protein
MAARRRLRVAAIESATLGCSRTRSRKELRSKRRTSQSVSALMVAVLGLLVRRAISPNGSPAWRVFTRVSAALLRPVE